MQIDNFNQNMILSATSPASRSQMSRAKKDLVERTKKDLVEIAEAIKQEKAIIVTLTKEPNERAEHQNGVKRLERMQKETEDELTRLKQSKDILPDNKMKPLNIMFRGGIIQPIRYPAARDVDKYHWEYCSQFQPWDRIGESGQMEIRPNLTEGKVRLHYDEANDHLISNDIDIGTVIKRQASSAKRQQYRFGREDPEFIARCKGVAGRILRLTEPRIRITTMFNMDDARFSMRVFQDRVARLPEHLGMDVAAIIDLCQYGQADDDDYIKMIEFCEPTIYLNPSGLRRELKDIGSGRRVVLRLGNPDRSVPESKQENKILVETKEGGVSFSQDARQRQERRKEQALQRKALQREKDERVVAERLILAFNERVAGRLQREEAKRQEQAERLQREEAKRREEEEAERLAAIRQKEERQRQEERERREEAERLQREERLGAIQQKEERVAGRLQREEAKRREEAERLQREEAKRREEEEAERLAAIRREKRLAAIRREEEAPMEEDEEEQVDIPPLDLAGGSDTNVKANKAYQFRKYTFKNRTKKKHEGQHEGPIEVVDVTRTGNGFYSGKTTEGGDIVQTHGQTNVYNTNGVNISKEDKKSISTIPPKGQRVYTNLDDRIRRRQAGSRQLAPDIDSNSDSNKEQEQRLKTYVFKKDGGYVQVQNVERTTNGWYSGTTEGEVIKVHGRSKVYQQDGKTLITVQDIKDIESNVPVILEKNSLVNRIAVRRQSGRLAPDNELGHGAVPAGELTAMLANMTDDWASSEDELNFAEESDTEEMQFAESSALEHNDSGALEFAESSAFETDSDHDIGSMKPSLGLDALEHNDSGALEFAESSAIETDSEHEELSALEDNGSGALEFAESSAIETDSDHDIGSMKPSLGLGALEHNDSGALEIAESSAIKTDSGHDIGSMKPSLGLDALEHNDSGALEIAESSAIKTDSGHDIASMKTSSGLEFAESSAVDSDSAKEHGSSSGLGWAESSDYD